MTGTDEVTQVVNQRTKRDSTLSLALNLPVVGFTGVVIHDPPTTTGSYTLTNVFPKKSVPRFVAETETDVTTYFPDEFKAPAASFDQFASGLTTTGDLGSGTISLEATLPPRVVLAWLNAKNHLTRRTHLQGNCQTR